MSFPHDAAIEASVLADDTGRRRRLLRRGGRALTALLVLWLVVLALGGLGLEPIGGLPDFGASSSTPPVLPQRVRAAVAEERTVQGARVPPPGTPAAGRAQIAPAAGTPAHAPSRRPRKLPKRLRTPGQGKAPATVTPAPAKTTGTVAAPGQVKKTTTVTSPVPKANVNKGQGTTTGTGQTHTTTGTTPAATPKGNGTPAGGKDHTKTTP